MNLELLERFKALVSKLNDIEMFIKLSQKRGIK
jgi:hypothetical protein